MLKVRNIRLTVFEALEHRALEIGQVTRASIHDIMNEFENNITANVGRQVAQQQAQGFGRRAKNNVEELDANGGGARAGAGGNAGNLFAHCGRFWDVPGDFQFPAKLKIYTEWHLWLLGMPEYETRGENGVGEATRRTVKPFRKFLPSRLPKKVADVFKLHWQPAYKMMEEGIGVISDNPSMEVVNDLYERGTNFMRTRVSYIFDKNRFHHNVLEMYKLVLEKPTLWVWEVTVMLRKIPERLVLVSRNQ